MKTAARLCLNEKLSRKPGVPSKKVLALHLQDSEKWRCTHRTLTCFYPTYEYTECNQINCPGSPQRVFPSQRR